MVLLICREDNWRR